jgi:putative hydrolase of the HAD superfamily
MRKKDSLAAIFFDIDDTLYSTTEFTKLARMNAVKAMIDVGLPVNETTCLRMLDSIVAEFGSNYEYHFDRLISRLDLDKELPVSADVIITAGVIAYHDTKIEQLRPFPDVEWALSVLSRQKNITLGIISEGDTRKQIEKLIRLKILKYFNPNCIFIAEQLGLKKLNPLLFRRVAERLKLEPSLIVYVGDNPKNDVETAKKVGFTTILYQRGGKYTYQEAQGYKPDAIVHDMMELLYFLQEKYNIKISG